MSFKITPEENAALERLRILTKRSRADVARLLYSKGMAQVAAGGDLVETDIVDAKKRIHEESPPVRPVFPARKKIG